MTQNNTKPPRKLKDGEWDGWGDYMEVKRKKLAEQFAGESSHKDKDVPSDLFNGVAIYVNGYTQPSADVLRRLIYQYGGEFHTYNSSRTTHVVCTNLPRSKIVKLTSTDKVVRPEWITDSIKERKLLSEATYLLYSKTVRTLQFTDEPVNDQSIQNVSVGTAKSIETEEPSTSVISKPTDNFLLRMPSTKTAKDPDFIKNYYAKSRLHMISTWGQEMKEFVKAMQANDNHLFAGRDKLLEFVASVDEQPLRKVSSSKNIFMHLDMDCFFVSVGLRDRPSLKGQPVAVTHSKDGRGPTTEFESHAEIASCSYEARNTGIKNGMWLGDALRHCPNLKTIPYDFEKYKAVSKEMYQIVANYTLRIEAVSCDELYADLSELCSETAATPLEIATTIRKEIFEKTRCPASAGLGPNMLVARLATRKAKPNGQLYVPSESVADFMKNQRIEDLPGVGRSTAEKLDRLKIYTCCDMTSVPLRVLQKEFGQKTGQHLHNFARGMDDRKIKSSEDVVRKSVSCDVNYGIRFTQIQEVVTFLADLSKEINRRLHDIQMKGRTITLKCLIRAEDAPVDTLKFLGHGIVDSCSKSVTLSTSTSDQTVIAKECLSLFRQMSLNITDLRGIGISIHKLETSSNRSVGIKKFVQKKDVDLDKITNSKIVEHNGGVEDYSQQIPSISKTNDFSFDLSPPSSEIDKAVFAALPVGIQKELYSAFKENRILELERKNTNELNAVVNIASFPSLEDPIQQETNLAVISKNDFIVSPELKFCGCSSYVDVKQLLKNWIDSTSEPEENDVELFTNYLIDLVKQSNMERAYRLLSAFAKMLGGTDCSADWKTGYQDILSSVQAVVIKMYSSPLDLPNFL